MYKNNQSIDYLNFHYCRGSPPTQFYILQRLIEENNFHIAYYAENPTATAKPREAISDLGFQVTIRQGLSPVFDADKSGKIYTSIRI